MLIGWIKTDIIRYSTTKNHFDRLQDSKNKELVFFVVGAGSACVLSTPGSCPKCCRLNCTLENNKPLFFLVFQSETFSVFFFLTALLCGRLEMSTHEYKHNHYIKRDTAYPHKPFTCAGDQNWVWLPSM